MRRAEVGVVHRALTHLTMAPALLGSAILGPTLLAPLLLALIVGCGEAGRGEAGRPSADQVSDGAPASGTDQAAVLGALFQEHGARGTLVIRRLSDDHAWVHDAARAARPMIPASTFKIVNAAVALETGAVSGPDEVIPWDGQEREFASWNRDHSLATGMAASAVPAYQEVARRVGTETMADWLVRLDYGNADVGGGIDRFWLTGDLRTSAFDQVDFVARWVRGELPLSALVVASVSEMLEQEGSPRCALHAKTGWAFEFELGWWIGWTRCGDEVFAFALNMDIVDTAEDPPKRVRLGRAALEATGAL